MSPRREVGMTAEEVESFLAEPRVAILTTLDRSGWPHSTAMWFVPRAGVVAMWAYAKSQKVVNLARDPRAAFAVESGELYAELKGVSARSKARIVTGLEEVRSIGADLYRRYVEPRTGVALEDGAIAGVHRQAAKRVGIELPLDRLASWDFAKL